MCLLLVLALAVLGGCGQKTAKDAPKQYKAALGSVYEKSRTPGMGDEWMVIAMLDSPEDVRPAAFAEEDGAGTYYENFCKELKKKNGVVGEGQPTDYARASIALSVMGKDASGVEGFDLLKPLENTEAVKEQGINAEVYALIAFNVSGRHPAAESVYWEDVLAYVTEHGDYAEGELIDLDAMCVQALSYYSYMPEVRIAIQQVLDRMAGVQEADGGFSTSESTSQAIIALSAIQYDPEEAEELKRDEHSLIDGLMRYARKNGFAHLQKDKKPNDMATMQGVLALTAYRNMEKGGLFPRAQVEVAGETAAAAA